MTLKEWRSYPEYLFTDALEILKKQEPKTVITFPEKYGDCLKRCPSCEAVLPIFSVYRKANFCPICGQAVKWE